MDHLVGFRVILEQQHQVAVVVLLLGEKQRGYRVAGLQLDQGVAVVASWGHLVRRIGIAICLGDDDAVLRQGLLQGQVCRVLLLVGNGG